MLSYETRDYNVLAMYAFVLSLTWLTDLTLNVWTLNLNIVGCDVLKNSFKFFRYV